MDPRALSLSPNLGNPHLPRDDEKVLLPGAYDLSDAEGVPISPTGSPKAGAEEETPSTTYSGLILLDWDGTIVTGSRNTEEVAFINARKTTELLKAALAKGMDIRIVTARPGESAAGYSDTYLDLLERLDTLELVNPTHNKAFWRERIHCVLKDIPEWASFQTKGATGRIEISHKKKTCVEDILKKPQYRELKNIHFYDDDIYNCVCVEKITDVTSVRATEDGKHFDDLADVVLHTKPVMQIRIPEPPLLTVELNSNEKQFFEALNNCLNAMYPDRPQWTEKALTNAGGIRELHQFLFHKQEKFNSDDIQRPYEIAQSRLDKGCSSCCPKIFGGRAAEVQRFYSILVKLGGREQRTIIPAQNLIQAKNALNEFAEELRAKRAPAPAVMLELR